MSVLDNNPRLRAEVDQAAQVAGLLWQKGWAERNGGNITVNVTDAVDEALLTKSPISDPIAIGLKLPNLKGKLFYCKGTNKRMRDLAQHPMDNGSIIRICDDCEHYEIIADQPVAPTSELPSHLLLHDYLIGSGSDYKACVHTHPIELVAMSHNPDFLGKDVLTRLLWSMIPETLAFAPLGLGIVPYQMPSSLDLANSTLEQIRDYDVVLWEKHGVTAVGPDVMAAFDQIDVLNKSAMIYRDARAMGFVPTGMSDESMTEIRRVFNLPTHR